MVRIRENPASSVFQREGELLSGCWTEWTRLRSDEKKGRFPGHSLAQVDIITIINLRNIKEVFSLNILDIPMAPAPSPLPFSTK